MADCIPQYLNAFNFRIGKGLYKDTNVNSVEPIPSSLILGQIECLSEQVTCSGRFEGLQSAEGGNFREAWAFMASIEWRRGGGHLQSKLCVGAVSGI